MNSIPVGYKQTDVGVIPEDWEVKPIGELQPFVTSGSRGWAEFYSEHGASFIRITNLIRDSIYLDLNNLRFVNLPTNNSEGARTQLQDGDVLISITADIGIVGYVSVTVSRPAYINQHIALVRFDHSTTNSKFVSYFLASEKPQKLFRALTDSGAKAGMNLTTVKQVRLALPPTKAEQEAIAEALSDTDALIESLEQLITKNRQIKQGAMQELLTGKKRLPGFSGEWEVKRLGNVSEIVMGQSPSSSNYNVKGLGLPLIQGNADIANRKTIKRIFTTEITKRGKCGDILMSVRAPVGEISLAGFELCLGRGVCAIRYPNNFMYHYLISQEPSWAKLSKGSTFDSVNSSDVKALEVYLPNEEAEQTAIATILSDMDAEITALETKLAKTRQLKQGMMHNLLTGRIRLVRASSKVIPFPDKKESVTASTKSHNWQINEAVIIAVLAKYFGSEEYPLARKRCTKLTYLLHRHVERKAEGYLKKAAGPYNPRTRYSGPETIAQKNGYVRSHHNGTYPGFVAAANISQAEAYFQQWYGSEALAWLEQFRRKKTDELELLATVDMAMEDLSLEKRPIALNSVKQVICNNPEWEAKLERETFSDANIVRAIAECQALFGS